MNAHMVSDREFGELLGKVSAIEADLKRLEKNVDGISGNVTGILNQIATVSGGMRVAIWFSGIIGALAMFGLTKIAPLFLGFLPKV